MWGRGRNIGACVGGVHGLGGGGERTRQENMGWVLGEREGEKNG